MSEKIIEELKNILQKARVECRIVPEANDRQKIRQKSEKLSFAERSELLTYFPADPDASLLDAGGILEARIRINDQHSSISKNRPLAYIEFTDGYNSRVEVIDIIGSVKRNATSIGHPVVVYAIHHWQQLLLSEKWSIDKSVNVNQGINHELSGKYIASAKRNLDSIGKALLGGIKSRAISEASALSLKIKKLKLELEEKDNYHYLFFAWERLGLNHINQTHGLSERIAGIKSYLDKLPLPPRKKSPDDDSFKLLADYPEELRKYGYIDQRIKKSTVIEFLKTDGKRFVYSEDSNCSKSLRPQKRVFYNAFLTWNFRKSPETIFKSRKSSTREKTSKKSYSAGFFNFSSRPTNTLTVFSHILTKPLTKYCEPIECQADAVISREFEVLIKAKR